MMTITRRGALVFTAAGTLLSGCAAFRRPWEVDGDIDDDGLIEVSAPSHSSNGTLRFGSLQFPCAVGRSGIVARKFEGDGGTPAGLFPLREVRYRPDRLTDKPKTGLIAYPTLKTDGWCDDPEDIAYNKIVTLPHQTDAEAMWREDHAYDVLAVIGYNDAPAIPGRGSAIFLHVARPDGDTGNFLPTAGCVALAMENLLAVLALCTPATKIQIEIA